MTARRVCRGATIGGALVLALLAGCTGDDDPAPPTSSSAGTGTGSGSGSPTSGTGSGTSTGTATGSPTTTATVEVPVPAAAKKKTAQGAEAFARFYVETIGKVQASGDSQPLRDLIGSCSTCVDLADLVDDRMSKGQHHERDTQELGLSRVLEGDASGGYLVGILLTISENKLVDATDQVVAIVNAVKVNYEVDVRWVDGGWKVERVTIP